jgi:hypothetical protein
LDAANQGKVYLMAGVIEADRQIQINEHVPAGARVFLFVVGLCPWIAPYQLLIKPNWTGFDFKTLFFSVISLGAIAVSLFFLVAALFGLNQTLTIDAKMRTIIYTYESAIAHLREKIYSFSQLKSIMTVTHGWTDGPSSHGLKFIFADGYKTEPGSFASLDEAHTLKSKIEQLINCETLRTDEEGRMNLRLTRDNR